MGKTLLDKVWDVHRIKALDTGDDQILIGLHLIHEVTSPQAFQMLKDRGLKVLSPERTFATVDHIVPTDNLNRPYNDSLAEEMLQEIEKNTGLYGITFLNKASGKQGIVHVVGPELGLTQPGMTIACGDSHTSTHGAFGAISFGVGTSQIRDILASQSISLSKPKVKKIHVSGKLSDYVYAKDVTLKIIADLGVNGGLGFAYEFCGPLFESFTMEERMTVCNMSIEGGARFGYVNPDQTTFDYIEGKEYAPKDENFQKAVNYWKSISSDPDAKYDDTYELNVNNLAPMLTWGINPGQAIQIDEKLPLIKDLKEEDQETALKAYEHMGFKEGQSLIGEKLDKIFIGSCTNSRISDLRVAAKILKGKKISSSLTGIVVPGSMQVEKQAEEEGLADIFQKAGFEWRHAGCSMCLAMNPDKLKGNEICGSTSNRNFIGRQGSPQGRTILLSPAMAAAAAIEGKIVDVRDYV